jgi:hypothetical protein
VLELNDENTEISRKKDTESGREKVWICVKQVKAYFSTEKNVIIFESLPSLSLSEALFCTSFSLKECVS